MLILGTVRRDPKIVAFRNDFCLSCGVPRRAYQVKTKNFIAFMVYPIFPAGTERRWVCSVCGRGPHDQPNLAKVWQWGIVLFFAASSVGAWIGFEDDVVATWFGRILFPPAAYLMLRYTLKSKPDMHLKEKLQEVLPDHEGSCPLCGQALMLQDQWRCSGCGVKSIPLKLT